MDRLIEIDIDQRQSRPLFEIETESGMARCLMDTGADIPVWCVHEWMFTDAFPNAFRTNYATYISGFDQGSTYADIWAIPELVFEDRKGRDRLVIHSVLVAVAPKTKISFAFVLSASMFTTTDYSVVNRSTKRYMSFPFDRDCYCVPRLVAPNAPETGNGRQIISGVDVFVQKET